MEEFYLFPLCYALYKMHFLNRNKSIAAWGTQLRYIFVNLENNLPSSQWWEVRGQKTTFRDVVFDPVLLKEMDSVNQHVCLMHVFTGWLSPPERLYMIGHTQG